MFNSVTAHLQDHHHDWVSPCCCLLPLHKHDSLRICSWFVAKHSLLLTNVFVPSEPSCRGSWRLDWTATSPDPHFLPGAATWGGTRHVNVWATCWETHTVTAGSVETQSFYSCTLLTYSTTAHPKCAIVSKQQFYKCHLLVESHVNTTCDLVFYLFNLPYQQNKHGIKLRYIYNYK